MRGPSIILVYLILILGRLSCWNQEGVPHRAMRIFNCVLRQKLGREKPPVKGRPSSCSDFLFLISLKCQTFLNGILRQLKKDFPAPFPKKNGMKQVVLYKLKGLCSQLWKNKQTKPTKKAKTTHLVQGMEEQISLGLHR